MPGSIASHRSNDIAVRVAPLNHTKWSEGLPGDHQRPRVISRMSDLESLTLSKVAPSSAVGKYALTRLQHSKKNFTVTSSSAVKKSGIASALPSIASIIQVPRCGATVCRTHLRRTHHCDGNYVFGRIHK